MSKLTPYERQMWSDEIHDILQSFDTYIDFVEEDEELNQCNYNPLLQEITGTATFNEYLVPAMRYDYQSDMEDVNTMDSRKYGDMKEAILCYKVSKRDCRTQGFEPLGTMDVILDDSGEVYYIEKIAERIGEYIVWMRRYPNGSEREYVGLKKIPQKNESMYEKPKKKNPYKSKTRITDWLYEVEFDGVNYSYARDFYEKHYKFDGGCSVVYKNGLYGKNLDWTYDNNMNFVIRMAGGNRYKSIGVGRVSGDKCKLTKEIVDNNEYSELYRVLPFAINSGINEKGVFVGVNVVPYGDYQPTVSTGSGVSTCALMLPRMILDNCASTQEAIGLIGSTNIYCSKDHEYHLIIGDSNEQYFVEFINNNVLYIPISDDSCIMTNFYLTSTDFNDIYHTTSPHGAGVERYLILKEGLSNVSDVQDMLDLLYSVRYTTAYDSQNPLLSEFVENYGEPIGDLTLIDVVDNPEKFDAILSIAQQRFLERSRDTELTWSTRHSVVYDVNSLSLNITVEEDNDNSYFFEL